MVRLAVASATAWDLDRLRETPDRIEASGNDLESFSRRDKEFHVQPG